MNIFHQWRLSLIVHGFGYGLFLLGLICALWGEDPWLLWLPSCAVVAFGCLGEIRSERPVALFRTWRMALESMQAERAEHGSASWWLAA